MRATKKELKRLANIINDYLYKNISDERKVEIEYGGIPQRATLYESYIFNGTRVYGRQLSDRFTNKEMKIFLQGIIEGVDIFKANLKKEEL